MKTHSSKRMLLLTFRHAKITITQDSARVSTLSKKQLPTLGSTKKTGNKDLLPPIQAVYRKKPHTPKTLLPLPKIWRGKISHITAFPNLRKQHRILPLLASNENASGRTACSNPFRRLQKLALAGKEHSEDFSFGDIEGSSSNVFSSYGTRIN